MQRFQFTAITVAVTLCFLFVTPESRAQAHTKGSPVAPLTPTLKPGHYVWHPEVSPAGPVVVLVSLPDQILYVYRNGVRIGRSTVSSGKPGKQTPTGVFTVLQKKVRHVADDVGERELPVQTGDWQIELALHHPCLNRNANVALWTEIEAQGSEGVA